MSEILAYKKLRGIDFYIEVDVNTNEIVKINGRLVSELTAQEVSDFGYRLNLSIVEENLKYEKRRIDGVDAITSLMSELRLNSIANSLPRSVNQEIEQAFKEVVRCIQIGWWITAKEEAESVVVQGNVTQELKDRILNAINAYIADNY